MGNCFQSSAANFLFKAKHDTCFYVSHKNLMAIKILGVSKTASFGVFDDANKSKLLYYPNEMLNLGLGFNYKWFGLDLAFNLPGLNNDNDKFGKTEKFDLQTHIYTRKIIIDANIQRYKGFYIKNPKDIFPNWQSDNPYPQRSDINIASLGFNLTYSFNNKKFSYKASFIQNEWQKKSAGSFLLGTYSSFFAIRAKNDIIPDYSSEIFNNKLHLVSATTLNLGFSFGYIYTFVVKRHYFLTLSLVPGFAMGITTGTTALNKTYYNPAKVEGKSLARIALGYNSQKYYYGILFVTDNYKLSSRKNNIGVNYATNFFKIYIGRKFSIKKR